MFRISEFLYSRNYVFVCFCILVSCCVLLTLCFYVCCCLFLPFVVFCILYTCVCAGNDCASHALLVFYNNASKGLPNFLYHPCFLIVFLYFCTHAFFCLFEFIIIEFVFYFVFGIFIQCVLLYYFCLLVIFCSFW